MYCTFVLSFVVIKCLFIEAGGAIHQTIQAKGIQQKGCPLPAFPIRYKNSAFHLNGISSANGLHISIIPISLYLITVPVVVTWAALQVCSSTWALRSAGVHLQVFLLICSVLSPHGPSSGLALEWYRTTASFPVPLCPSYRDTIGHLKRKLSRRLSQATLNQISLWIIHKCDRLYNNTAWLFLVIALTSCGRKVTHKGDLKSPRCWL